jgi:hypothetical protein
VDVSFVKIMLQPRGIRDPHNVRVHPHSSS